MTVPEEGYDQLLQYLGIDEKTYSTIFDDSRKVWEYTSEGIGKRDFWQVSQNELRFLYTVTRIFKPRVVAETGVGPGSTSYAYLRAMEDYGGKLISFDLGKKYGNEEKGEEVGFLVPASLRRNWNLILGNTRDTLEKNLEMFGKVGIFMHDSEHTHDHVKFELETAYMHMDHKFMMIVDNYDWTSSPNEFASKNNLKLFRVSDDMCFIIR